MTAFAEEPVSNEEEPVEYGPAVCDRCSMPVIQVDGVWQHAEAADTVFCAVVMGGAQ